MSYFHIGREHDEPIEHRRRNAIDMLASRNRTGRDDEPHGEVAEADGFITVVPKLEGTAMDYKIVAAGLAEYRKKLPGDTWVLAMYRAMKEAERAATEHAL